MTSDGVFGAIGAAPCKSYLLSVYLILLLIGIKNPIKVANELSLDQNQKGHILVPPLYAILDYESI